MEIVFAVEQRVDGRLCVDNEGTGRAVELSVPTLVSRRTLDTEPFLDAFLLNISRVSWFPYDL